MPSTHSDASGKTALRLFFSKSVLLPLTPAILPIPNSLPLSHRIYCFAHRPSQILLCFWPMLDTSTKPAGIHISLCPQTWPKTQGELRGDGLRLGQRNQLQGEHLVTSLLRLCQVRQDGCVCVCGVVWCGVCVLEGDNEVSL